MYIKASKPFRFWRYCTYAGNHREMMESSTLYVRKLTCIRAAKKMAKKLGTEYREN